MSGHASLTTTLRYMHAVDGVKEDAIDSLERVDARESGYFPARVRAFSASEP
ncbi:hypothetical protein [Enhygromyxa salina]|uniref:Phage integrase family protein n=1 Tax=Enhygromyxa salina TaxID=215803 RepID=A0A2S9YXX3_9BACT|nr:hypothetical protein [Enhygromyxa salina]PRQ09927.1 hypothetical protein ENSA7_03420 [Enhygromyxa salina]